METSDRKRTKINYLKGDATTPFGKGNKIIVHICNDIGKWGKGFVLSISKRWSQPEREYKTAFSQTPTPSLGDVQFVVVSDNITVANLIGQHGIKKKGRLSESRPPIRYKAVRRGLEKVADYTLKNNASVHMPRIGCGLAGGEWTKIEAIINENLCNSGIIVNVYDYP